MKTAMCQIEDGRHSLEALVTQCGNDVNVQIFGGEKHHIGAVALGVPRESLAEAGKTSASVSVLCVTGHKDDELARLAAAEIAACTGRLAVVCVGIHVDAASEEDIHRLQHNFAQLLEGSIAAICAKADG